MQLKWENDLKSDPNTEEYKEIYEKIKNNLEEIRVEANDKEKIPKLDNKFIDFFKTTLTSQIKIESFNAAKVDSHGKKTNKKTSPTKTKDKDLLNIEEEMSEGFGHKIEIEARKKKSGKVAISYNTSDELENIISKLIN